MEDGAYGRWFADPRRWAPYVAAVAARHGLPKPGEPSAGVPGSHPVFLTDGYVVKFYAPHWPEGWAAETAVYDALSASRAALPVPRVLARGALYGGGSAGEAPSRWPWPYLVLTAVAGRSVGELRPRLRRGELARAAADLAAVVRSIHDTPAVPAAGPAWTAVADGLIADAARLRAAEGGWSAGLLAELTGYARAALGGDAARCLVHADLTEDHMLMVPDGGGHRFSGVIDFADAVVGEPAYELVALRLSLLRDEPEAQAAFRAAYGRGPLFAAGWRRRATACALVFPYGVGGELGAAADAVAAARTCAELEELLWVGFGGD